MKFFNLYLSAATLVSLAVADPQLPKGGGASPKQVNCQGDMAGGLGSLGGDNKVRDGYNL
jgi:hypothetical protein